MTDQLSIRALDYLADPRKVAAYLDVPVEQVVRDRRTRATPNPIGTSRKPTTIYEGSISPSESGWHWMCADGSKSLLRAMLSYGANKADPKGLPGLSDQQFLGLCREHGVRAVRAG